MNTALAAFDRRFFAPAPIERLAALRVLVGTFATVYLAVRSTHILNVATLPDARFEPVGVVAALDVPLGLWVVRGVLVVTVVAGLAFTAGWRFRLLGPVFAVGLLGALSYGNSWQHVAHTENLLVLHVGVLAISPASLAWSLDARRRDSVPAEASPAYGWPVRLMTAITVITYVLAGVAKLRHGGLDWVTGDVLRNLVAHDNLRKITLGDVHSPIAGLALGQSWLFGPLAALSMAVELGAPVALVGGRVRTAWVSAAWLFHVGVLALMAVLFIYPLSGVAFASMLRPEDLLRRGGRRLNRWRRRPVADSAVPATYGPGDV